jgi:hypothetical protein
LGATGFLAVLWIAPAGRRLHLANQPALISGDYDPIPYNHELFFFGCSKKLRGPEWASESHKSMAHSSCGEEDGKPVINFAGGRQCDCASSAGLQRYNKCLEVGPLVGH